MNKYVLDNLNTPNAIRGEKPDYLLCPDFSQSCGYMQYVKGWGIVYLIIDSTDKMVYAWVYWPIHKLRP